NITLVAGSLTDSGTISGNLLTTTTSGGVIFDSANAIATFSGTDSGAGEILLSTTGALNIGTVTTDSNITLSTTGDIIQSGNISTTAGDITVTSSTGSIDMNNGMSAATNGGNISYSADGNIGIWLLNAAAASAENSPADVGTVTINSGSGSVVSNNPTINANVRADTVDISVLKNIGVGNTDAFIFSSDIQGTVTMNYGGQAYIDIAPNFNVKLTIVDRGVGAINTGAARSAGTQRSQSSGLEDVGFIDLALFSDINLFVVDGIGITLPADQSDVVPSRKNIPVEDEEGKKKKKKRSGLNVSYLLH
ncbi:MAG: hypothetical protein OEZ38_08200, partial [Gammaproteobacteria bacterium]|nr:hypothetical protein [Gammaproteobacteria bacterium]